MLPKDEDKKKKKQSPLGSFAVVAILGLISMLSDAGTAGVFLVFALVFAAAIGFVAYAIVKKNRAAAPGQPMRAERSGNVRPVMSDSVLGRRAPSAGMTAPASACKSAPPAEHEYRHHEETLNDLYRAGIIDHAERTERLARLQRNLRTGSI